MVIDKEKLDNDKEEVSKDKLRLESREKELEKAKQILMEGENKVKVQTEGMQNLAQMLKIKEERLKRDRQEVDKYLGSI